MNRNITKEEFAEWNRYLDSFEGRVADMEKVRRYKNLAGLAKNLLEVSPFVKAVTEAAPSADKLNGIIFVDMENGPVFSDESAKAFAEVVSASDLVMIAEGKAGIRLTIGIRNIWSEG